MRRHGTFGAALLVGSLALPAAAASCRGENDVVLRDVEVVVSDGRIVLSTPDGDTYELAGLETPPTCPAAGGGTWACAEGAREALAAAVAGETLRCRVIDEGTPPAAECFAQTRNLNVWMLHVGRAKLQPAWSDRIPEYDEAQLSAQSAGAMVWDDSPGDADNPAGNQDFEQDATRGEPLGTQRDGESPDAPRGNRFFRPAPQSPTETAQDPSARRAGSAAMQAAGRTTAGAFLLRRQDGDVFTYVLTPPADGGEVALEYAAGDADLSTQTAGPGSRLDDGRVPALGMDDLIVHHARGGEFAYARPGAHAAGDLPLAYIVAEGNVAGEPYADVALDGMAWTSRRGALQPLQVALWATAERRGATAAERRAIASGLPEDQLRAGVWAVDAFRIVVAEDAVGCARWTWCRFAVLDDTGVVVSGTAREAPALPVPAGAPPPGTPRGAPGDFPGLVWLAPAGDWMRWAP